MSRKSILLFITALVFLIYSDSGAQNSIDRKREIAKNAKLIEERGGDFLGFSGEILAMLENSCGIKCRPPADDFFEEIDRADEQAEHIDPYSIFSGGIQLRSVLQLETVPAGDEPERKIDPASLSSPVMKNINYSSLLKGKTYSICNIDRYTPADFYYLHFSDAGRASEIISYIEDTASALRRRISPVSAEYMTREKITTQLSIREGRDLNLFYSSVIDELVITGSDPFLNEGSDVTLIIRPKEKEMLLSKLKEFRREFKLKFSCEEIQVTASGVPGVLLRSQGRRVHSYLFVLLDGTVVVSNSLKASEAVIDTSSGRRASLAEAPDYLYTRSLLPARPGAEDGFLYIPDLFVKHLSSPLLKITEARRVKELMRMAVLEKYAIYHYLLNGRKTSSVEEISSSAGGGSLNEQRKRELAAIRKNPSYSRTPALSVEQKNDWSRFESALNASAKSSKSKKRKRGDSGAGTLSNAMKVFYRNMTGSSAKTPGDVLNLIDSCTKPGGFTSMRFAGLSIIDGTFTATSETYGRTGYMTPCIDIDTGMASVREAENYRDFARDYSSSGEAYISPGGIRFSLKQGVSAEAFIFRSGDNPFFSVLSAFAGGEPVSLNPDSAVNGDVVSLAVKLDPSALDSYLRLRGIKPLGINGKATEMKEILSGEIQLHIGDSIPPAGFNSSSLMQILKGGYGHTDAVSGLAIWSLLHPLRITIPVKDSRGAEAAIESVKRQLAERWNSGNLFKCDTLSFGYKGAEVNVLRVTMLGSLTARIYSTVKDGVLHITTTEKSIKSMLEPQPGKKGAGITGNAAAVIRPAELQLERDMYKSGFVEESLLKSRRNFGTIKLISLIYPDAKESNLPDIALRDFGFRPVCPLGGDYLIEKKSGEVYSSLYGIYTYPSIRNGAPENGPVYEGMKKFFSTGEIRAEIEFQPEGMKVRINTK